MLAAVLYVPRLFSSYRTWIFMKENDMNKKLDKKEIQIFICCIQQPFWQLPWHCISDFLQTGNHLSGVMTECRSI